MDQKSRRSLGYVIAYQALLAVLKALTQGQYTGWKAALWWIFFVVAFSAPILIWHRRFQIPLRTYLIFSTVVLSVLLILRILLPLNALTQQLSFWWFSPLPAVLMVVVGRMGGEVNSE